MARSSFTHGQIHDSRPSGNQGASVECPEDQRSDKVGQQLGWSAGDSWTQRWCRRCAAKCVYDDGFARVYKAGKERPKLN